MKPTCCCSGSGTRLSRAPLTLDSTLDTCTLSLSLCWLTMPPGGLHVLSPPVLLLRVAVLVVLLAVLPGAAPPTHPAAASCVQRVRYSATSSLEAPGSGTRMSTNWSLIHRLMVAAQPRQGGQGLPPSRKESSISSHSSCTAD